MNENDPRVIRTKKMFLDAFKALMMSSDDYMDITVKELCEKAGLNRRTFYLHYDQIEDVLLAVYEQFIDEFTAATKNYDHIREVEPIVKAFFDLTEANPVFEKILLSPAQDYLREEVRGKTVKKLDEIGSLDAIRGLDILTQNMVEQFYHMSTVAIYREWGRQRKIMPKNDVVRLAATLIRDGLSSITNV